MRITIAAFFIFAISIAYSQNLSEPKNSLEVINTAENLMGEKNFVAAVEEFNKVPRGDTNYTYAQLRACSGLYKDEKYDKIPPIAEKIINDCDEYKTGFYEWWIKALIQQKKWKEAETVISKALNEFPLQHHFKVFRALSYKEQGASEEAKIVLQEIIKVHSFSDQAHFLLGKIAAEEGDVVRGILSVHFAILCNNDMVGLQEAYDLLRELCEGNNKAIKKPEVPYSKVFRETSEIFESGAGLKDKYVSDLGLNYSVSKQFDVLMKSLEYKAGTNDFWMDFYVPMLLEIKKKKQIAPYTLAFVKVLNDPSIKSLADKNKETISSIYSFLFEHYSEKTKAIKYPVKGITYNNDYYYDGYGNLFGVGELKDNKKTGKWTIFHINGNIKGELNYKNGELDGYNIWYDKFGNVNKYFTQVGDKLEGEAFYSDDVSGLPSLQANYKNSEFDGKVMTYYDNGRPHKVFQFKNGKKEGEYKELSYGGEVFDLGTYKNDLLNGKYTEYYKNGKLFSESEYINGELNGPYKKYHNNGQISFEANYVNGKETGRSAYYHKNGKLQMEYTMTPSGKADGVFYTFNENGDTASIGNIKKGLLNGLETNFSSQGKLYSKIIYAGGSVKSYEYFDSTGKVISSGKNYLVVYDEFGYKAHEGLLHKKLGNDGIWKYYYKNGLLQTSKTFVKGKLEGPFASYYYSGKLKEKVNYKNDQPEGHYLSYYENGNIETEGWLIEGEREGAWKEYSMNGKLIREQFYHNGVETGFDVQYNNNGKIHSEAHTSNNVLNYIAYFDTTGALIQKNKFNLGTAKYVSSAVVKNMPFIDGNVANGEFQGPYKALFPNGKTKMECTYIYGDKNGKYTSYFFTGNINESGNYSYDNKEGMWQTYYRDGQKKGVYYYEYDVLKDSSITYFKNGKISSIEHYDQEGEIHGINTEYHDNGALECKIPYLHGLKHGSYIVYDKKGIPVYKKTYVGGILKGYSYQKNGAWVDEIPVGDKTNVVAYYPNGQKSIEFTIENDNYNGSFKRYHSNGKLWMDYQYLNDDAHGKFVVYNEDGSLHEQGEYVNGNLHGNYKAFTNTGILLEDLNYFYGELNGECKFYTDKGKLQYTNIYYQDYLIKSTKF